ncbi:MAG: hypothetical protein M9962_08605 [Oligoflexia bacterium]|nr:hypothetical protein [Oligoflexia bacterium]
MRKNILILFSLILISCSTQQRAPNSAVDGVVGVIGQSGSSGKSGGTNAEYWYERTPLQSHYHFAIINGDMKKMKEWVDAGFTAHTRATERHPTAIEQAIDYQNYEIVELLVKNPNLQARPDLRKGIIVCKESPNSRKVSFYDYIVYNEAVEDFKKNECNPNVYQKTVEKLNRNLYIRETDWALFQLFASIEDNPIAFREETKIMLAAFKKSNFSKYEDSANSAAIKLIESAL